MKTDVRNDDLLRNASGNVSFINPLTTFLYILLRDELPVGTVEKIVREVVNGSQNITYTNGWLAKYANDLAEAIINRDQNQLQKYLEAIENNKTKVLEKTYEETEDDDDIDMYLKKLANIKDSEPESWNNVDQEDIEKAINNIKEANKCCGNCNNNCHNVNDADIEKALSFLDEQKWPTTIQALNDGLMVNIEAIQDPDEPEIIIDLDETNG